MKGNARTSRLLMWYQGKKKWKRLFVLSACIIALLGILCCTAALAVSGLVCNSVKDRITNQASLLQRGEHFDLILVLGCRVYSDGTPSHMLYDRVVTGVALYDAGLSDRILFSGDSEEPTRYDEVGAMCALAAEKSVPASAILEDPLGLSTYESIYRASAEHQGKRILIVTQEYHLYRALYLAEQMGLDAYGVSADLRAYRGQIKFEAREILARCKDVFMGWLLPAPDASRSKDFQN